MARAGADRHMDGTTLQELAERQERILARITELERCVQELKLSRIHPARSLESANDQTTSPSSTTQDPADLSSAVNEHPNAEGVASSSGSDKLHGAQECANKAKKNFDGQPATSLSAAQNGAQTASPADNTQTKSGSPSEDAPATSNGHVEHGTANREEAIRATQQRLEKICRSLGCDSVRFKSVPEDYYGRSLEERRDLLGAPSVEHLCKSIVMTNTQAPAEITDCSNPRNSKYYVVVVQYVAKLNAEKVKNFVYGLNEGTLPKKRINMRLAPSEVSDELTGYSHNSVTPFGMRTNIPVILSDAITRLSPPFFWLGAGEVNLKLGLEVTEFVDAVKPFVVDCT